VRGQARNKETSSSSQQQQQQKQQTGNCETVKFQGNLETSSSTLAFPKEEIRQAQAPSELARLFPPQPKGGPAQSAGPTKSFTIFLQKPVKKKVPVTAPQKCTVGELIDACLEQHKGDSLKTQPEAYELRLLEDMSGTPDFDFDALERSRLVMDLGDDSFALVEVKGFVETGDARRPSQWSAGLSGQAGATFIKVHLPDKTSLALNLDPSKTMREVLQLVAKKRGFKIDDMFLAPKQEARPEGEETPPPRRPLEPAMTVREYGKDEIALCEKQFADRPGANRRGSSFRTRSSPEDAMTPDFETSVIGMNRFTAGAYKEYSVVKINQHRTREARIMGIDSEHITNQVPKSGGLFSGFKKKVATIKRPQRPISDVLAAEPHPDKPKAFNVTFKGDSDKAAPRSYTFEAASEAEAAEIVAKLRFLRGMLKSEPAFSVIREGET